jgi:hypothetical protein
VLDAAVNVSSHTRPFRFFEYMIVVALALAPVPPCPTATQYIPFHAIRFTTVRLISVFRIPFHDMRSVDHAIDAVFASLIGAPSPPTIHTLPFHVIALSTPVIGTFDAGVCVHVTPSFDVATFEPVTAS